MIKVIITEESKSNKPVAIITLETAAAVIDHWVDMLVSNPERYKIEILMEYTFCEDCSKHFHDVFGNLLLVYQHGKAGITETETKCAFIGALQGFAYSVERRKLGEG